DLGRAGGIELPWSLLPAAVEPPEASLEAGAERCLEVERVEAGSSAWTHVRVCSRRGLDAGAIGQDVWSAAPACFDFIHHRLVLRLEDGGRLPHQPATRPRLPVVWDRAGR